MVQKTSPFIESKYGWNLGESNWNTGADENFIKFAFMLDNGVDGVVNSLPQTPVNGTSYYLTSDNRFYFVVDGTYYSSPCPKWFTFKIKTSGQKRIYDGSGVISLPSDIDVSSIIGQTANTASKIIADLASPSGSSYVNFIQDGTGTVSRLVQDKLRDVVSVKDFGVKGDGTTNDLNNLKKACASGKPLFFPSGRYLLSDTLTCTTPQKWVTFGGTIIEASFDASSNVRPLLDFKDKITSYGEFVIDHKANTKFYKVPTVYSGNPIAGSAVLVQGDWSSVEDWYFINAWDNGLSAVRLSETDGKEIAGSPKFGSFRNIKSRDCGVGEHEALTPGKIGAGVDVASASAWTVSDCVDFGSYIGYILDIGAGAQAMFTNCIAFYTKVDTNNPLNGSGHGFYSGSSESCFTNCYSVGSAYRAWRIDEVGTDFVNCGAYIPQQEGVFIKAGQFKGSFRIKGAGFKQANTYDAVLLDSSAKAIVELELELHTTGSNHRYGLNATGGNTIDAHIQGSVTGTTGIINRQNYNIGSFLQNASTGAGKRFGINRDVPGMEFDVYGRMRATADRANSSSLTTLFGDTGGNGTFFVEDFANPSKRMAMGYDPVNDAFVDQAIHAGTAKKPRWINPAGGEVMAGTGLFNEPLRLGNYRIWVDGGGLLRIKNGAPTSATDGTVVGTQTG